jgi:hypothetical protein
MSLQECLARRKDCSGEGQVLKLEQIEEICNASHQAAPEKVLFIILPEGEGYSGGIYKFNRDGLTLINDSEKTKFTMELYPELILKEPINYEDLIRVGITWQYFSLKVDSLGLGVSQRARKPKKFNKIVNNMTNQDYTFLYSVAARKRDKPALVEDKKEPIQKSVKEGIVMLDTPMCYKEHAIYENNYKGLPLDDAIYNRVERKAPNNTNLHQVSQLLWACQGETDHSTHGNRDILEKNGYGRVHASGCAGYAIYPILCVKELANISEGSYIYNPVGFSALNRWVNLNGIKTYDHFIQKFTSNSFYDEIKREFEVNFSNYTILLCFDRNKPCANPMHRMMNIKYWAEVEVGMALAGLQLQANAFGLKWEKKVIANPDEPNYRTTFELDVAEQTVNEMASFLVNRAKNERLTLEGNLVPIALFHPIEE